MKDEVTVVYTTLGRRYIYVNGRIAYNDVELHTLIVNQRAYEDGAVHLPANLGDIPEEARIKCQT
jgi:hypothetical protein